MSKSITPKSIARIPAPAEERKPLCAWALVELFGHQRIVGKLTEEAFGNAVMFRVDVPDLLADGKIARPGFTRYFGVGSIYGITPVSEELVRKLLPEIDGLPARPLSISSYDE